jgi:hypothetical protein
MDKRGDGDRGWSPYIFIIIHGLEGFILWMPPMSDVLLAE